MKKLIIITLIGLAGLTSCLRESDFQQRENVFTACIETSATKTTLEESGDGYKVLWTKGDRITITDGNSHVGEYTTESVTQQGVFTFAGGEEAVTPSFEAWYPSTVYNGGSPTLPSVLSYVPGNLAGVPMKATGSTSNLTFKNLTGIIRLNISSSQEGKKVRKIVLKADKPLSGPFTVTDDAAVVSGSEGLTLDCGEEGVAIGTSATAFFMAVPAGTYNPLKITVITTDGDVQTRVSSKDIVIARSKVVSITLGFGQLKAISGSSPVLGGSTQPWVQLWPDGPRWAKFNVGSTVTTYADITEYTHPDVTGGYYSYKGRLDSTADSNQTEDTAYTLWGPNWATPTYEQEQELLDNCVWTFCDGTETQYEPGCTLKGWKVSGKEPGYTEVSIFLPYAGIRDQNIWERSAVGGRGVYWSSADGGSGAYYLNGNSINSCNQPHGLSVRAICVADEPVVEGVYILDDTYPKATLYQFETYTGDNPRLILKTPQPQNLTLTRADGELDMNGQTLKKLYLQNNDPEKVITVRNGIVSDGIDGKDGQSDYFSGQVVLEAVSTKQLWTDGHAYTVNGGVIDIIEHKKNASSPGTVTILDGSFGDIYRYVDRYGGTDDGCRFILYGGHYSSRPPLAWCAEGHYTTSNTDPDAETYPFKVVEGDPSASWFTGAATDLSASATANTYIVSAPGTYKFKATVKGNGGLDPITGATATPINAADISGATVLWELKEAGRAIKYQDEFYQIAHKDGYVWFNTPDTFIAGDAYVAVFKDGDGGKAGVYDKDVDEILWSWLIWTTEQPSETVKGPLTIMDRNIGALSVNEDTYAAGFLYQWGRKDPFPAGTQYNRGTQYSFYPAKDQAFSYEAISGGTTMAYSVAHPTTVIGPWDYESWLNEEEFNTGIWSDTEKTIYDPCPAGWRIPGSAELNLVFLSGVTLPGGGAAPPDGKFNAYCNGGSAYYWSSTAVSRTSAWCYHDGLRNSHYDLRLTTSMSVRPVKEQMAERTPAVLVQHWPFDGNAFNAQASRIRAVVTGPVTAGDRFGNADGAYSFDGDDKMTAADAANFGTSSFSANLWVKSTQTSDNGNLLRTDGGFSGSGWMIRFNNGRVEIWEGRTQSYTYVSPDVIADDQWHMITYVRDMETLSGYLYIDGVLNGSYIMTGKLNDVTNELCFGTYGSGEYYIGLMDDVRLYDGVLSASQIRQLYTLPDTYPVPPAAADISIPGSANTFMITTAGTFTFDATVKGNGGLDPKTNEQAPRIDKAGIAGVKVLWEVYEQGRAIKHDGDKYALSYADGKVTLQTPDVLTPGAAYIAIYDSSDTILWSWLIWTTPEPGTKDHNGAVFMDRNLGGIDAGNCMRGFLYQWGRKDPFSAADGDYKAYPFVPSAADVFTFTNGPVPFDTAVQNPACTYRTDSSSWVKEEERLNKAWRSYIKTIYDPCPEGWHVPDKGQMSGITGMPATGIGGGYEPTSTYKGFGNPGKGYYWTTSTDSGADTRAYAFVNDGRNIQHWSQSEGYAIRCVKE